MNSEGGSEEQEQALGPGCSRGSRQPPLQPPQGLCSQYGPAATSSSERVQHPLAIWPFMPAMPQPSPLATAGPSPSPLFHVRPPLPPPGAQCANGESNTFDEDTCLVLPEWAIRSGPRKSIYFEPEKVRPAHSAPPLPGCTPLLQLGLLQRVRRLHIAAATAHTVSGTPCPAVPLLLCPWDTSKHLFIASLHLPPNTHNTPVQHLRPVHAPWSPTPFR